jgi:DNA-binding NarL/FixJ family response regulator
MSREQGLTHKQIAQQLNISEKTVDEQIGRALKKLRMPLGKLANFILML